MKICSIQGTAPVDLLDASPPGWFVVDLLDGRDLTCDGRTTTIIRDLARGRTLTLMGEKYESRGT